MAKAKVKFIMTVEMETLVDQSVMFDPRDFEEVPTIKDSIKAVVDSYLDNPVAFVENENSKLEIKYDILGEFHEYKFKVKKVDR